MIRFNALGAPDLRDGSSNELRGVLTQPRLLALLVYLAIGRPRGFHRRDKLVALFWPEVGHEQARNALRQVVHRLRAALGDDIVVNRGAEELGIDEGRLWCDVAAFERALDGDGGDGLESALELYRGDLLPGFFLADAPEFERWLDDERNRLRQRSAAASWRQAEREAAAGRGSSATHWARRAAGMTPDDEPAVRRLIDVLLSSGDHAGALRTYEAFSKRLADDLDLAPSRETQALVAQLQPAASAAQRASSTVGAYTPLVERPTGAAPSPAVSSTRRSATPRRLLGAGVAALIALAAIVAVARGRAQRGVSPTAAKALAVFPFAVRSSGEMSYLREGMMDLLSAKLEGASRHAGERFRAIDPRSVIGATAGMPDATTRGVGDLASVARRLGADWLVVGDVVEIAGRLQVSGSLYEVATPPRLVTTASVSGEMTALFELVDDLTGRILAGIAPGRDTSLTRLAALTTHSLPALKAFLLGEQALRAGQDAEATAAFRDAATLDTTFALAQYRLALASTWALLPGAEYPATWAAAAVRHATRLPPLFRDLLHGYAAYKDLRTDEAERLYRSITESHPDNVEAWLMLGEVWIHYNPARGRSPSDARAAFERALVLDPNNAHAMIHLARLDALEGQDRELDSLARRYTALHSDAERITEMRVLQTYMGHDSAQRARAVRATHDASDLQALSLLQGVLFYSQNFDAGLELAPAFVSKPRNQVVQRYARLLLTDLPLAKGQWAPSVGERGESLATDSLWLLETKAILASDLFFATPRSRIDSLRTEIASLDAYPSHPAATWPTLAPDRALGEDMRRYLLALLSIRVGDTSAALRYADTLAAVRDSSRVAFTTSMVHGIRAELARSRGEYERALAELGLFDYDMRPLLKLAHWGVRERFLRAEVLHALGRDVEALSWYASLAGAYDLPFIAASHFRRGEIKARLGDVRAARFHYTRCLSLWTSADAELQPLIAHARVALEKL